MSLIDLLLISYCIITPLIGFSRGFNVELTSLLKSLIAIFSTFFLANLLESNFALSVINNPYILISTYFSSFVFSGFFVKIILLPLNLLLQIIIPTLISNFLGLIIALIKLFVILLGLLVLIAKFAPSEKPNWISDSYLNIILQKQESNLQNIITNYDNLVPKFTLPENTENDILEQQEKKIKSDSNEEKKPDKINALDSLNKVKSLLKYYKIIDRNNKEESNSNSELDIEKNLIERDKKELENLLESLN